MQVRVVAAIAVALLMAQRAPLAAQRTRDRPTLIFTVSGARLGGSALWTVPDQIVDIGPLADDHFRLSRSVKRTFGAAFTATYFQGQHLGLTAEAFLVGLGYDDACQILGTPVSSDNIERCRFVDERSRSAAAVVASVGSLYRFGPREFISPFIRAGLGILINNQSPLLLTAQTNRGELLMIYDDESRGTRLRPAIALGVGTTIAMSATYHIRWEIRDNILGIQALTGPVTVVGQIPPSNTVYKHIFSLNVGLDVILERQRGRRY